MTLAAVLLVTLCSLAKGQIIFNPTTPRIETWTGRWLPERPAKSKIDTLDIHDDQHGIKMGVISNKCDDAKTNLTLDWDFSPANFTCFYYSMRFKPSLHINPLIEHENIPKFYTAQHQCMDEPILYNRDIPTFGTHRPLWSRYGEYKFVPRQRWLHNLEHGGIVMLYHPCANPLEVYRLRQLVTRCLRRHVITPYTLLDPKRPLALLAWGWRLTMSTVDPNIVQEFIQQHAVRGPEAIVRDGQYDVGLLVPAKIVTTEDDSVLCPPFHQGF